MKEKKRVAIVVMFSAKEKIGGHILSALELAKSINNVGDDVSIFTDKKIPLLSDLNRNISIINDCTLSRGVPGLLYRFFLYSYNFIKFKFDFVITFDKTSCYHLLIPSTLYRRKLIPILPGGNGDDFNYKRPIERLPVTVVFSNELREKLIKRWSFPSEKILVNSSRFSFEPYGQFHYSQNKTLKIAYISGLREDKLSAFNYFIEQVKIFDRTTEAVQIDIIGAGISEDIFRNSIKETSSSFTVTFTGYKQVTISLLRSYDLVVSMGRGVIEAISSGVPVAICGPEGYKGLVSRENFDAFSFTNFTGRDVKGDGVLLSDIGDIRSIDSKRFYDLSEYVRQRFDISRLRDDLYKISDNYGHTPFNGNVLACINYLYRILK